MSILVHDNVDDRKEMWNLLAHPLMTDFLRLQYVRRCSQKAKLKFNVVPIPGVGYTPAVARQDLLGLVGQAGLDFTWALNHLVETVRKL